MKPSKFVVSVAAVCAAVAVTGVAEARNPHCAGGIQYVAQALRDKDRGNMEDYQREIGKAVQQLEMCSSEDPKDFEALGYLGWAYAEVDSARAAGVAFAKAIAGLKEKGDKRKAEAATNNRDHYWSLSFNEGIAKINSAQSAYPDFTSKPETPADETLKAEAEKKYQQAIHSLQQAELLNPEDVRATRNLGATYAFMGQYQKAVETFRRGLKIAPADSDLVQSLRAVQVNRATQMIEEKNYEGAIAVYDTLLKRSPADDNLWSGLADAHFKRAQSLEGDARKPEFKAAGDGYAKAAEIRNGDADLTFNAALAYQNAGEPRLAEPLWRETLKVRPDDTEAMSSLGSTLADLRQYDEAIRIMHKAVVTNPKNRSLHRQFGAIYTKAGNNPKGTEELMVYLALQNGRLVEDVAAQVKLAKAGSGQAKVLASNGTPEEIYLWDADNDHFESWFYWSKRLAFHFKAGILIQKSDWSTPATRSASAGN